MKPRKHQTFEEGALMALELAIATLVRVMPELSKEAFIAAYPQNVEMWSDTALPSTGVSDEWLSGLRETADNLHRLAQPKAK